MDVEDVRDVEGVYGLFFHIFYVLYVLPEKRQVFRTHHQEYHPES